MMIAYFLHDKRSAIIHGTTPHCDYIRVCVYVVMCAMLAAEGPSYVFAYSLSQIVNCANLQVQTVENFTKSEPKLSQTQKSAKRRTSSAPQMDQHAKRTQHNLQHRYNC